jgi:hypothetical protein
LDFCLSLGLSAVSAMLGIFDGKNDLKNKKLLKNYSLVLFEDKMNYDAVRRLSNPKLRSLLKQVPGAEGTIFYLKLMYFLTNIALLIRNLIL